MKEIMAQFNSIIILALPGIPVSIGQELNWDSIDEYAKVVWPSGNLDEGVTKQRNEVTVDVELYSKAANVYRIVDLVEQVRTALPRTKIYAGDRWFEIKKQIVNFLELEIGKKAVLTMKLGYWR